MINLYALTYADLAELMAGLGEPGFRAQQIWDWMYEKRVGSFTAMTNLPRPTRLKLSETARLGELDMAAQRLSHDGTEKRLYRLPDGQLIESVLMPYDDNRRTACISSQAGCAFGCIFCATGQMGFGRHLSAAEIFRAGDDLRAGFGGAGRTAEQCCVHGNGRALPQL